MPQDSLSWKCRQEPDSDGCWLGRCPEQDESIAELSSYPAGVTLDLLPTASSEPAIYTTCPAPSIITSPSPAVDPSMSDPTDFPRLRPFPHDHERTSMDADVQPTRKPRCLVKREATSPSTTRDAEAGPSKPKRVKVEHPIETKGIIDEHDWEEEGYKTRQGTIGEQVHIDPALAASAECCGLLMAQQNRPL